MRHSIRIGRRGVTLVELVVVLALIAILSTTIVLMSKSLSGLVSMNNHTYDNIENLSVSREFIEKWFHTFDSEEYVYEVNNDNIIIKNIDNTNSYTIRVNNGLIEIDYPDIVSSSIPRTLTFKNINDIKFKTITERRIFKCTIIYDENLEFSFVLSKNSK